MHPLKTLRLRRDVEARFDRDHGQTPRELAIEWLAAKIIDGRAGLDPTEKAIFVVDAEGYERTWAYRALELTGIVLNRIPDPDGGERFWATLEADVHLALGLDAADAPVVDDPRSAEWEPESLPAPVTIASLARPAPQLRLLEPADEPVMAPALREARAAYEKTVH